MRDGRGGRDGKKRKKRKFKIMNFASTLQKNIKSNISKKWVGGK